MVILDVEGAFDMTEFKSIQELLNALYSCIAIDDKGNAYLRTNSSGVTPDPDPDPDPGPDPGPTPTFTRVGSQDEDASNVYKQYLIKANLAGIHCQRDENGSGSFVNELGSNTITTIKFSGANAGNLAVADVAVKNENGIIYLQDADNLNWIYKPDTFQIKCGHLMAIKNFDVGDYTSPDYEAPRIIIGDQKDSGYGDLCGILSSLVDGIKDQSETIYYNLFEGMFATSPRLVNVNVYYPNIIGQNIYRRMFANCPILNTANLYISNKTVMNTECIGLAESIFDGCGNLSKLNGSINCDEIPAARMFANAFNNTQITSLTIKAQSINEFYKTEDLDYPLYNWLGGASNRQGTITKPYALTLTENSDSGIPTNWTVRNTGEPPTPPEPEKPDLDKFDPAVPLCIENVGDVQASIQYNTKNTNIRISKDYKTWNDYTTGTEIKLNPKDRVYIKSDYIKDTGYNPRFKFSGDGIRLRARGNIASLIYGTNDAYVNKYTLTEEYCYFCMFNGCTSLTQAPELPATTLADGCYSSMFYDCTSLTQAPDLPAVTLVIRCYSSMFYGCTSLTQAPELPAMTLANGCYSLMFNGCTSLTQAPELPAMTLALNCYSGMFKGCTSLTQAPELPATILFYGCYRQMFEGCTSLTQAPELPATKLVVSCYQSMFSGCTKLNYVKCLATDTSATECTTNWLSNVSSTGTFECDNKKYFTLDSPNGIPKGWTITEINPDPPTPPEPEKPDLDTFDPNVPFCIENVGDVPVEIGMYDVTKNIRNTCEISYNNKDWITYNLAVDPNPSDIKKIKLQNKGDRVYIKSNHSGTTMSPIPYTRIKVLNESAATKIQARGNIASLNYARYDEYKTKYNSTEDSCYSGLFMSCKSLIKAPDLVATSLSKICYMFMFSGCTNLKYIKCLATNISASNCTNEWVRGVSATGNFYTPASTTWSSGISGIPQGWTRHDIT